MKTRQILAASAALAMAGVGLVLASPASAHTPSISASCAGVTARGTNYSDKDVNTIKVRLDGKGAKPVKFGWDAEVTMYVPQDGKVHKWSAWIQTINKNPKFSLHQSGKVGPCGPTAPPTSSVPTTSSPTPTATETTSTPTTPPTEPTPTETTTTPPTPTPTETTSAPQPTTTTATSTPTKPTTSPPTPTAAPTTTKGTPATTPPTTRPTTGTSTPKPSKTKEALGTGAPRTGGGGTPIPPPAVASSADRLPTTGGETFGFALVGASLLAAGGALLVAARRRERDQH